MQFPLIGGHAAIDFLNTSFAPEGEAIETIPSGRALVDWFVAAGLLEESAATRLMKRFGAKALDGQAAEARKLRDWAREWLMRWRARPGGNYSDEIAALNRWLARGSAHHELVQGETGLQLAERPSIDDPEALLTLIAMQIALLLTQEEPALVKSCAGEKCTLWFVDRTKAHRRVFCSASACGNRAKVAAFRERQRR